VSSKSKPVGKSKLFLRSRSMGVVVGIISAICLNLVVISPASAMLVILNNGGGSTAATLDPGSGQYFPVAPTTVLDTSHIDPLDPPIP
jgi:hypothetical protein